MPYFLSIVTARRTPNLGGGGSSSQVVSFISSFYSSELTYDHPQYDRDNLTGQPLHYYETIEIKSSANQNVTLTSNSSKDLYGYLYDSSFTPSQQNQRLLDSSDDDGAGVGQFEIEYPMSRGTSYILVVTTFSENVVAPFTIEAIHQSSTIIEFNRTITISPSGSNGSAPSKLSCKSFNLEINTLNDA